MGIEIAARRIHHVPGVEIPHPALHLPSGHFFRLANQSCKDSRFMNAGCPQLLCEPMVSPDPFCQRVQQRSGNTERSEERRVGKEWRVRGWAEELMKNTR